MTRTNSAPAAPWVLGLAGLAPFAASLAGSQLAPAPYDGVALASLFAYSAVILSFLGGTRWGFEIGARPDGPSPFVLFASILPALLGWFAVLAQLVAPMMGLGVLAGGFALMWLWDVASTGAGGRRLPGWYAVLRSVLSVGALATIGAAAWLAM